jgi:sugar O-acyltransferase (sialic acid O-acetyltransferase NeuD family)
MKKLVLVGGGGHCISCIDVLRTTNEYEIAGILDIPQKMGMLISGVPVIGSDNDIQKYIDDQFVFLITVGQIKSSETRMKIYNKIKNGGGFLPVIVSGRAYVSSSAYIGEGTIVMHNGILNAYSKTGVCCIINTGALLEHEASVGDFCHISTYAVVNGQSTIGSSSFIGSTSVIANNVTLPEGIIVAAGAAVLRSPDEIGTYIGNPARKIT